MTALSTGEDCVKTGLCCVELFGGLQVRYGQRTIRRFRTQKTAGLLAYLAFFNDRMHSRETLVEMLWPDAVSQQAGRLSLSVALSSLRTQLEPSDVPSHSLLLADRTTIGVSELVTTDVILFERALDRAVDASSDDEATKLLSEAVSQYRGVLLPGHYDGWITAQQERLADRFREAALRLAHLRAAQGMLTEAIDCARRAAAVDALCEETSGTLIRLLLEANQPAAALRQYNDLKQALATLNDVPSPETEELVSALLRGSISSTAGSISSPQTAASNPKQGSMDRFIGSGRVGSSGIKGGSATSSVITAASPQSGLKQPENTDSCHTQNMLSSRPSGWPSNSSAAQTLPSPLPLSLTRFFGRQREVAKLLPLLRSGTTRLVTLTGPGGIGKTRLALELARQFREESDYEVVFVPLVSVRDAHQVPRKIEEALGIYEEETRSGKKNAGHDPLGAIVRAVQGRRFLFVLDNIEQFAEEGAETVAALLLRAPSVTCLATSRVRLPVDGEAAFAVPPLPTRHPSVSSGEPLDELNTLLQDSAAVDLFVDRAQLARPDFALTRKNAAAVTELVARLEGIPLAIEFAAARAQVMTPALMLEQIGERFRFLVSHRRLVGGHHHQSLHAALLWSYELLTPEQQKFFRFLSVFRCGWTVEAAGALTDTALTMDLLAQLVDASLISVAESDEDGNLRFSMMETVREFASQQLTEEERADAERRHRCFFRDLAEKAEPHLQGAQSVTYMEQLEADHDNLRAALGTAEKGELSTEDAMDCLRLGAALPCFWTVRGHITEARRWASVLQRVRRDLRRRRRHHDASSSRSRSVSCLSASALTQNQRVMAKALNGAGILAMTQGDNNTALRLYRLSVSLRRRVGDERGIAATLNNMAILEIEQKKFGQARAHCETSLALWRSIQDIPNTARVLSNLGLVAFDTGDYDEASRLFEEALNLARRIGDVRGEAMGMRNLGEIYYLRGNYMAANERFLASLPLFRELKDIRACAATILNIGFVLAARNEAERAKQFIEIALECYDELQTRPSTFAQQELSALEEQRVCWASLPRLTSLTGTKALNRALAFAVGLDTAFEKQLRD